MALQTGKYEPRRTVQVYAWPVPDVNGEEEIWEDQRDSNGNVIGRQLRRDHNGNVVKRYAPPPGFKNVPSQVDGQENYVLFEEGKGVVRDPDGNAISVREGQAVVIQPDGTARVLEDEYAQYLFGNAHESVSDDVDTPEETEPVSEEETPDTGDPNADELAEFRAWKAAQETEK